MTTAWEMAHLIDKCNNGDILGCKKLNEVEINTLLNYLIKALDSYCNAQKNDEWGLGLRIRELQEMYTNLKNLKKHLKSTPDKLVIINAAIKKLKEELKLIDLEETEKIKKVFATRLKTLYSAKYDTPVNLETALMVSQQTVHSYLNGLILPSYDKLLKIAEFLGCSVDYLINDKVTQTDVHKDAVYKDIGLDTESINIIRHLKQASLKNYHNVTYILNALIHRHYSACDMHTDVLTALTDYLIESTGEREIYTVSEDTLDMLKDHLKEVQSLDDIPLVFANFKQVIDAQDRDRAGSYKDPELLHLKNIEDKVKNASDDLREEYLEYLKTLDK